MCDANLGQGAVVHAAHLRIACPSRQVPDGPFQATNPKHLLAPRCACWFRHVSFHEDCFFQLESSLDCHGCCLRWGITPLFVFQGVAPGLLTTHGNCHGAILICDPCSSPSACPPAFQPEPEIPATCLQPPCNVMVLNTQQMAPHLWTAYRWCGRERERERQRCVSFLGSLPTWRFCSKEDTPTSNGQRRQHAGPQHSMFVSRMDHQMDMAWNYLAQGEKSSAQKCFAVGRPAGELVRSLVDSVIWQSDQDVQLIPLLDSELQPAGLYQSHQR